MPIEFTLPPYAVDYNPTYRNLPYAERMKHIACMVRFWAGQA